MASHPGLYGVGTQGRHHFRVRFQRGFHEVCQLRRRRPDAERQLPPSRHRAVCGNFGQPQRRALVHFSCHPGRRRGHQRHLRPHPLVDRHNYCLGHRLFLRRRQFRQPVPSGIRGPGFHAGHHYRLVLLGSLGEPDQRHRRGPNHSRTMDANGEKRVRRDFRGLRRDNSVANRCAERRQRRDVRTKRSSARYWSITEKER